MEIGKEPNEKLLEFCFVTINKALFEMSQNRPEGDRRVLANILQNDLNEKFYRLTCEDVGKAFHKGVREGEQMSINPRTWFNWLNKEKLKANALRIKGSQDTELLAIETKCANIDKAAVLKEFLELCVIELYEAYCEGEKFTFQGSGSVYKWLEDNGFIMLSKTEKVEIMNRVKTDIKARKFYAHNEKKEFHPVSICKELVIKDYFKQWRDSNVNLREEIYEVLNNK
mgnify:CR=1 FL=1|tara:strand:- start:715 stop:1395 length:681 start_codon:yes stop_codon:yes gene_type:complete